MSSGNISGRRERSSSKCEAVDRMLLRNAGEERREMTWCPIRVARGWPPKVVPCMPVSASERSERANRIVIGKTDNEQENVVINNQALPISRPLP